MIMSDDVSSRSPSDIIDASAKCTLDELCRACNVEATWVIEMVEHGVLEPTGPSHAEWQFTSLSVVRVARARRLERDLSLNPPGVALALELLDEIEALRLRLKAFEAQE